MTKPNTIIKELNIQKEEGDESQSKFKFDKEKLSVFTDQVVDLSKNIGKKSADTVGSIAKKTATHETTLAKKTSESVKNIDLDKYKFNMEDVIQQLLKVPAFRVNRDKFLHKELKLHVDLKTIDLAISKNPAYAGIEVKTINIIAKDVIKHETNKASSLSFLAGLPGGFSMLATIPADVIQYFGNLMLLAQKLAYLYGYEDMQLNNEVVNDSVLDEIMIFFGVMSGVQAANAGLKVIADNAAKNIAKQIARKPLTKTTIYPIVKSASKLIGIRITKEIYAKNLAKVVPVIGGVISGGLTYTAFTSNSRRLQRELQKQNLCKPEFYRDYIENEI